MGRAERRAADKAAKTELKKLQALPVDKFAGWLGRYSKASYEDGYKDGKWSKGSYNDGFSDGVESNTMAMMRYLHDEFGFGNTRFQRLIEFAKKDVQAMREGYITPKEVKDGLAAEGVTCLKQMQMKGEPDPLREWVPVETTLPPDEDKVLCCTVTKKGLKNIVIGYYAHDRWCCGMNSNVIAWRFLPPAYEEKCCDETDV